jgi:hypothetical protein
MRCSEPHVLHYMHMRRTSILLDPGLLAELERLARRDGRPTSQVIREALEGYVNGRRDAERSLPGFVGMGRGPGDVAENVEELLADEAGTEPAT